VTLVEDGNAPAVASLSERYAQGEQALDGACPIDNLSEGGYCAPIGRPWTALLADDECEHGRLPGDRLDGTAPNWPHTHACGCWPSELPHVPTPVGAPMLNLTPKEPLMLTAAPARVAVPADPRMRNYRAMEPSKLAACLRELEGGYAIIDGNFTMAEHLAAAQEAAALVAPNGFKKDGTPRKSRAGRPPVTREPVPVALTDEADSRVREAIAAAAEIAPPPPRPVRVAHASTNTLLDKIVADIDAEIARLQAARDALAVID
jgi:hypothetical protein